MFHRRILSAVPSSSSGATARRYIGSSTLWRIGHPVYWKLKSSTLKNWIDLTCAGRVQAGGQQGGLPVVGDAQEQAWHELRDDGQGTQVRDKLFSGRNYKQIAMLHYQNIKSVWRRERHFWGLHYAQFHMIWGNEWQQNWFRTFLSLGEFLLL